MTVRIVQTCTWRCDICRKEEVCGHMPEDWRLLKRYSFNDDSTHACADCAAKLANPPLEEESVLA